MNLILFAPDELAGGAEIALTGRRARHIAEVMRPRPGDSLRVGVVRGRRGSARVIAVASDRVVLEVELSGDPPPPPDVDLILALPRPKVLARALELAASFGVRRIDLVNAWRVDKSYFSSNRLDPEPLAEALARGCEQGGTTWVPELEVHRLLVPFLARANEADVPARRVLAHPGAPRSIESALGAGAGGPVVAAIGPEGGWIASELASFEALGFAPVALSSRVLRVETAIASLLSQLELLARLPTGLW